jgi:adenine-specific DNA-methyltransferase
LVLTVRHSEFLEQLHKLEEAFRHRRNVVIQGDNRSVLQHLRDLQPGEVSCIYIDPPYNNQEDWTHYADSQAQGEWLESIVAVANLLRPLLAAHGSLWVSIDDKEVHYLKVALDAVFGRDNFVTSIVWQQRTTRENRKVFSNNHEYVLVYARHLATFKKYRNGLPPDEAVLARYGNPDNDSRGPWQSVSLNAQAGHATASQFYEITAPTGRRHRPPKGRCWAFSEERMKREIAQNNIWFGRDGNGVPRQKRFLADARSGLTPHTLWLADEVGTNDSAKKHMLSLFPDQAIFDTPKPERLVRRIFEIASNPGDLVLDCYLGSGTSAAVAQKIGRRYIGIELGDHIVSHCLERLRKVAAGEDAGVAPEASRGGGPVEFVRMAG